MNFGDGHAIVPRPVHRQGVVYICTGYPKPQLRAIDLGGTGDATETHVKWTYDKQVPLIASPIVVGREDGLTTVTRAAREYEELSRNQLPRLILASPAVYDGALLIRNSDSLFCLRAK